MTLLRAVQAIIEVGPLTVVSGFRAGRHHPGREPHLGGRVRQPADPELLPDIGEEELATLFTLAADHTALVAGAELASAAGGPDARPQRRLELSATSHPGVLDFADEMGVGSIVLLDEPSEEDMERLADTH